MSDHNRGGMFSRSIISCCRPDLGESAPGCTLQELAMISSPLPKH